jgi:hypothetical protein
MQTQRLSDGDILRSHLFALDTAAGLPPDRAFSKKAAHRAAEIFQQQGSEAAIEFTLRYFRSVLEEMARQRALTESHKGAR